MTSQHFLVVGSYTGTRGSGSGITTFARDEATGSLELRCEYAVESPSYLAAHPRLPLIYAVSEADQGVVSTFEVDRAGQLSLRARCPSAGAGPCHCAVTGDGRHLITCNYTSGDVAVLPLDGSGSAQPPRAVLSREGSGPQKDRQEATHPHMAMDAGDGTILIADLGTDEVVRLRLGPTGSLAQVELAAMAPGTGPRQLAVLPGGRDDSTNDPLVIVGELTSDLTLLPRGLRTPQTKRSTIAALGPQAPSSGRNHPAHLEVGPGGRIVYLTNRGADCVTSFAVEPDRLRFVDRVSVGAWPRHMVVIGSLLYVAAQHGHVIDLIRADHHDGSLARLGQAAHVASPTCVLPISVPN